MKGVMHVMRTIRFNGYLGPKLPKEVQKKRLANVIENELTAAQRRTVIGYYLENKTIIQLAEEFGVNKSTVSRTLRRAEARMQRCLRY